MSCNDFRYGENATMSRMLSLAALCLYSLVLIGCGEETPTFKDANDLPPLNANDISGIESRDAEIADAERAEGQKTYTSKSKSKK